MRGEASVAGTGSTYTDTYTGSYTGSTYKSLMARLTALQEGVGPDPALDGTGSDAQGRAAAYRRRIVRAYFGCGLVTSLIAGGAALLPLVYAHPGARRHQGLLEAASADVASAPFRSGAGARTPADSMDSFELPIRHSQRADAPFPLEITGAGPADAISVVLRNVPEAAWLSSGERQDEHTWLLRPADLGNLRLSLRAGTPDFFDVTIEVASAAGDQTARGVARIRLLDGPAQSQQEQQAGTTLDEPPARDAERSVDPKAAPQQRGLDAPFRTQTTATPRPADTTPQQKAAQKPSTLQPSTVQPAKPQLAAAEDSNAALQLPSGTVRPTRPDGLSALGALPREPNQEGRQLWWKMPTPSWAPFPDVPGRN